MTGVSYSILFWLSYKNLGPTTVIGYKKKEDKEDMSQLIS